MKTITFRVIGIIILSTTIFFSCSSNNKEAMLVDKSAEVENSNSDKAYPLESMSSEVTEELKSSKMSESNEEISESKEAQTSSSPSNFIASHAASATNEDGKHKLIRTADMKFKVKNVPSSTYGIESIVIQNGGHILRSHIDNTNTYSYTTNISKDSAIVTHSLNLKADIQFRVHYSKLDTVLREIAPYALYIDFRTVNAQDVTLQLWAEKLKKDRMEKKQRRISSAIDNQGRKLDDIMDAEQALDNSAEEADNALLADYEMRDRIEYCTVRIALYEETSQYKEKIVRPNSIKAYEPSFGSKVIESLQFGLSWVSELFIVLLNIWPILLIIGIGILIAIKNKKKKKDNQS